MMPLILPYKGRSTALTTRSKTLASLEDTVALAQALAKILVQHQEEQGHIPVQALLFKGDLGSGKTTFTRALVQALPGGMQAEVSSPSFTLCNMYKTTPPVLHADLYRCAHSLPEEVWEALDNSGTLSLIEWSEHLPKEALPKDFLDISLKICHESRLIEVSAFGSKAEAVLRVLL